MMDPSIIDKIAKALDGKPSQVATADVQLNILALNRMAKSYEKRAVAFEVLSLAVRAKAFSSDTSATDRMLLMRQSTINARREKECAACAGSFLVQLGKITLLETTIRTVDEMKKAGLLEPGFSTNWKDAMDTMQTEIHEILQMTTRCQKICKVVEAFFKASCVEYDFGRESDDAP